MEHQAMERLTKLETQQALRHEANQRQLDKIDETTSKIWDKLDGLQCQAHREKMKSFDKRIAGHGKYIFFIITSILGLAFFIIKGMFK